MKKYIILIFSLTLITSPLLGCKDKKEKEVELEKISLRTPEIHPMILSLFQSVDVLSYNSTLNLNRCQIYALGYDVFILSLLKNAPNELPKNFEKIAQKDVDIIELKCLGKISPSSNLSDRQKEILKGLEDSENAGLSRTPLARENAFLNGNQCASKILLSKESQAQYSKDYFDFFLSM